MPVFRFDKRASALLAAPAFALALAACGGGDTTVDAAPDVATDSAASADAAGAEAAPAVSGGAIQRLSPDEAIANAQVNQPNLTTAPDVLDIQTLAVHDGSVQTLRDVVDGDKPVLLWFYSPH